MVVVVEVLVVDVEVVDVDVVVSAASGTVVVVGGVESRPQTRKAPNPRRAPRNKITRILETRDMKAKIRPRTHQPPAVGCPPACGRKVPAPADRRA
jgi:hypothetical protein